MHSILEHLDGSDDGASILAAFRASSRELFFRVELANVTAKGWGTRVFLHRKDNSKFLMRTSRMGQHVIFPGPKHPMRAPELKILSEELPPGCLFEELTVDGQRPEDVDAIPSCPTLRVCIRCTGPFEMGRLAPAIAQCPTVRSVEVAINNLRCGPFPPEEENFGTLRPIVHLITSMDLERSDVTEVGLARVGEMNSLTHLNVGWVRSSTAEGIIAALSPPKLCHVTLQAAPMCIALAERVGRMRNLINLSLSDCRTMNDEYLCIVMKSLRLTALDISLCRIVTIRGIDAIVASGENLLVLNITCCISLNDDALVKIAQLPKLTSLFCGRCPRMSDRGIEEISKIKTLQELDISIMRLTDEAMEYVSRMWLRALTVSEMTSITDAGLAKLRRMNRLQFLSIGYSDLYTDAGIEKLFAPKKVEEEDSTIASSLKELHLSALEGLTDASMDAVARHTVVVRLHVDGCRLTSTGVRQLSKMSTLRMINVFNCRFLSSDDVILLRKSGILVRTR